MTTIWKFPIRIEDRQTIEMPFGAEIIHAGLDPSGAPCVWANVQTANSPEPVGIFICGTGHPIPGGATTHVGSFQQASFMWHVFIA